MDIYIKKKRWKLILAIIAIVIGLSSLFITNNLVNELKNEERNKIELWADATKHLVNIKGEGDYSLAIKVISENSNIPVILVDECDSILEYRNFKNQNILTNIGLVKPRVINNTYLRTELNHIKENGDPPIEINIIGDLQWIYYKDSDLLYRLRYYPLYQLGFIGLFMFIAYFIFSSSRKSEQNQVWAGMAKETAHQIGTPLSSLMAWIELLKESSEKKEMVSQMGQDVKRLETIADRFSKIGSRPELKKTNIIFLIEQSIKYLKLRMPTNIDFELKFPNNKIEIPVNKILFEWVIENLVKNAVDAMKGKGKIVISVADNEKNILINISDNGAGIDRSISNNIFKPGVTSKKRGWGLGLSLSKRIIEDYHKGNIFVVDSKKGEGTTFAINLSKN
jgi:signal transduction histidine kinase